MDNITVADYEFCEWLGANFLFKNGGWIHRLDSAAATIKTTRELYRRFLVGMREDIEPEEIDHIVCVETGIKPELLRVKVRKREIVSARQLAMYFYMTETRLTLAETGHLLGGFDHAIVLHATKVVNNLRETDRKYRALFSRIEKQIILKKKKHAEKLTETA